MRAASTARSWSRVHTQAPRGCFARHSATSIPSVGPDARLLRVLRVARGRRQEVGPAAAQHDLDAVAVRELDELSGDVVHTRLARRRRQDAVVLPVPVGGVGVGTGRRRVRDAGGGDDAGPQAAVLCLLEQRRHGARGDRSGIVADDRLVDPEHARACLHAGEHRGDRGRGVGHLEIGAVGLRQGREGERLEGEHVLLAGLAAELPFTDPCGGDGRHAHAVADEEDDVACPPGVADVLARRRDGGAARLVPGVGGQLGGATDCAEQEEEGGAGDARERHARQCSRIARAIHSPDDEVLHRRRPGPRPVVDQPPRRRRDARGRAAFLYQLFMPGCDHTSSPCRASKRAL